MTRIHVSRGGILIQVQDAANLAVARRDFLTYLASLELDGQVETCQEGLDLRFHLPSNHTQAWAPNFDTSRLSEHLHLDPVARVGDLEREILVAMLLGPVAFVFPSAAEAMSAVPLPRTSPTANPAPAAPIASPPPVRPTPTNSSCACRTATTRWWANVARACRAASASASPSPGRCCSTRPISSSPRQPRRWTPRPRRKSRRRSTTWCAVAPRSPSPIACPPCARPTGWSSWIAAASSKSATTMT